jgi:TonB family protein
MLRILMGAVGFSSLLAAPLLAQHVEHSDPTRLVTLAEWTGRMNLMLDREIRRAYPSVSRGTTQGVVRVKFNCSEDGRPDKVTLLKSSGSSLLDKQALRAVERVASLHPLPTGFRPDQKYVAVLVFASDPSDVRIRTAGREQMRRNAWYHDPAAPPAQGSVQQVALSQ